MPTDEFHYRLIRLIESRPDLTQRELARELGVSLGKTNYCIKALIDKGWIKTRNFRNSSNKLAYAYILTPQGMARKWYLTRRFLERKQVEYDNLRREINQLSRELESREQRGEAVPENPESAQGESIASVDTR
ncbi:MAG: MarR family EPS-associated transcriptional regulator [Gammaproteobacteria bacterium]|nr:MarR family EPS-associated transcriptional regulator [Gammaproteobacteria bacterium]